MPLLMACNKIRLALQSKYECICMLAGLFEVKISMNSHWPEDFNLLIICSTVIQGYISLHNSGTLNMELHFHCTVIYSNKYILLHIYQA